MEDVMNDAFLGLGGNVGDTLDVLSKAKVAIEASCGHIQLQSSIYQTEAWGLKSSSKFLNQVIKIETRLSIEEVLKKILEIEASLGRVRSGGGYSDRIIDIDLLLFNKEVFSTELIEVPHPRLHLRKFVLIPLTEIAGKDIHPILQKTMEELLASCLDTLDVQLIHS